jgi:hypothetical protein
MTTSTTSNSNKMNKKQNTITQSLADKILLSVSGGILTGLLICCSFGTCTTFVIATYTLAKSMQWVVSNAMFEIDRNNRSGIVESTSMLVDDNRLTDSIQ